MCRKGHAPVCRRAALGQVPAGGSLQTSSGNACESSSGSSDFAGLKEENTRTKPFPSLTIWRCIRHTHSQLLIKYHRTECLEPHPLNTATGKHWAGGVIMRCRLPLHNGSRSSSAPCSETPDQSRTPGSTWLWPRPMVEVRLTHPQLGLALRSGQQSRLRSKS